MKLSLKTKLSGSYVLVALFLVIVVSILSNYFVEGQFKNYVIKQQNQRSSELVSMISKQYSSDGKWDLEAIENMGINSLSQGLIIKVKDIKGNTIWDATVHNSGLCAEMLSHVSTNMSSLNPNFKGKYVENSFELKSGFSQVGTLSIGYYGPYYYNDNEILLLNTLNKLFAGLALLALILSLIVGTLMARRISTPISRVINATRQISNGKFSDRILEKNNTKEIIQLTTAVNEMAMSLEKQEILRQRITADVAHELRTPLATLQSHMEAMIDGIWKPDTSRLKSCHEEIIRISKLVGNLEVLARYESENLVLEKTNFSIDSLIKSIITNFETEYLNKSIGIDFFGSEEVIYADRDKISQAIINLISNSLKYTNEGGHVTIILEDTDDKIVIKIADTGIGIPPDDLPYIFERFYRADKSRNRMTGGSGIGLAITKAIINAHKGEITVLSELNKGTEFIIYLPKK